MKTKLFFLPVILFAALKLSIVSICSATVITFDDLSETASGSFIANDYHGFSWNNFAALNGILWPTIGASSFITNGYYYGTVSASNIAVNGFGPPAEINSLGTNFNFLSAYLTGGWNSNLNVEIQGFRGPNLMYDQIVVIGATAPTPFTFDYMDIDRLYFSSFGGQPAFGTTPGFQFVLDNLTFEFVPEPSPFLLTAAAALMLWPILKRKRV